MTVPVSDGDENVADEPFVANASRSVVPSVPLSLSRKLIWVCPGVDECRPSTRR
jgi:hypothetical protein